MKGRESQLGVQLASESQTHTHACTHTHTHTPRVEMVQDAAVLKGDNVWRGSQLILQVVHTVMGQRRKWAKERVHVCMCVCV